MNQNILADNLIEELGAVSATSEIVRIELVGVVGIDGEGNSVLDRTIRLAFSTKAFQKFSRQLAMHASGIENALGAAGTEVHEVEKLVEIPMIGDCIT